YAAAADFQGNTITFDATTGATLPRQHGQWVQFIPGTHIEVLTDYFARKIDFIDTASGQPVQPSLSTVALEFPTAFSKDGRTLYAASNDGTWRMYDLATQLQIGDGFAQDGQIVVPLLLGTTHVLATSGAVD